MAGRRTNLALLALTLLAAASGGLAFAAGTAWGVAVVLVHGLAGIGLVLLAPWKQLLVRRGLRRRRPGSGAAVVLTVVVVATVASGIAHSAGWTGLPGGLTMMQLHVGAALASLPLVAWHLRVRPVRPRRTDLTRRNLVRATGLAGGAGVAYAATEGLWTLAGLPGATRRFTGSHERGSFQAAAMPVTQWLFDDVPRLDPDTWGLRLIGDRDRVLDLADLDAFDDEVTATLDCTGGWYAVQTWQGARLDRLLPAIAPGMSIRVRSATGYERRLPPGDASRLWLATRVNGERLSAGHGFPARLVAPGRRGFWWVKWVTEIATDERPWWAQAPFPLQ